MTDAEREEILDNIETMLASAITSLQVARCLFVADAHTLYLDEAMAAEQCKKDLRTIADSIELRRYAGNSYEQPERIAELVDTQ